MLADHTYFVAEISANHGHDINIVKQSIKKAAEIGCDAVKIQTYTAATLTLDCDNEYFQLDTGTIWDGTTLYKLYQDGSLPWEWHEELFAYAKEYARTFDADMEPDYDGLTRQGVFMLRLCCNSFRRMEDTRRETSYLRSGANDGGRKPRG